MCKPASLPAGAESRAFDLVRRVTSQVIEWMCASMWSSNAAVEAAAIEVASQRNVPKKSHRMAAHLLSRRRRCCLFNFSQRCLALLPRLGEAFIDLDCLIKATLGLLVPPHLHEYLRAAVVIHLGSPKKLVASRGAVGTVAMRCVSSNNGVVVSERICVAWLIELSQQLGRSVASTGVSGVQPYPHAAMRRRLNTGNGSASRTAGVARMDVSNSPSASSFLTRQMVGC